MSRNDLVLFDEEYQRIQDAIARLRRDANAMCVFMIEKSGQPIASAGEVQDIDATSLASLAAGNVAATEGLAQLIGEREFYSLYHEGEHQNILMTLVGGRAILLVIFNEGSSLGLVRLRVRKASVELTSIFETVHKKSGVDVSTNDPESPFAEITDEDIDKLFSD